MSGTLKSAAGIGAILLRGIGDTIRVSLLGDPVPEIAAGFDILRACDRRVNKPEVVACPTCGEVELTSADITLMVCSHAPLSYYAFDCPRCSDEIRKPADDHVISLLISGGVKAISGLLRKVVR